MLLSMTFNSRYFSLLLLLFAACGDGGESNAVDGGPVEVDAGGTPTADAAVNQSWAPLVTGSWTLPAGGEEPSDNHCSRPRYFRRSHSSH